MGYITSGGAKGVGTATTKAVVYSSVSIFVLNYLISAVFLMMGW
jgi:phospholipid/cholesterol/gamma-HCH transport system permease protein